MRPIPLPTLSDAQLKAQLMALTEANLNGARFPIADGVLSDQQLRDVAAWALKRIEELERGK